MYNVLCTSNLVSSNEFSVLLAFPLIVLCPSNLSPILLCTISLTPIVMCASNLPLSTSTSNLLSSHCLVCQYACPEVTFFWRVQQVMQRSAHTLRVQILDKEGEEHTTA